ncbi:lysophospholipase L1-like esterase [Saccharothrix coeruleofusca]|uniref:SGNH/GDSL hydrolase family protein n=1 Tax=Saccharothrix coeruleofusca TaxID=33919 RepID=UPI001AE5D23D|nr:SGNH/GDSL hydrolase family protein [Saccharothrix coeruleofusca]MBP2338049.1 lysophospholipase L1-like esterase [Saccharothrix coeruleofusca]
MTPPTRYAALGSSFAAGPGIPPIVDVDAVRSGRNYPRLLAKALGAELVDLSVSGATTATILDEPQLTMTGARFPPQIGGVPATADLVTITAGGNDLRFAGSLLFTAWNRVDPDGPMARMLAADFPSGIPAPTREDVDRTAAGLVRVVERVRDKAPRARVVLVDYLTIIGAGTSPGVPFEPAEVDALRDIQDALEAAYVAAAERTGAELVAVSRVSRDHALGSTAPWVQPFLPDLARTGASFHPNAEGMAVVAAEVEKALRQDRPTPV